MLALFPFVKEDKIKITHILSFKSLKIEFDYTFFLKEKFVYKIWHWRSKKFGDLGGVCFFWLFVESNLFLKFMLFVFLLFHYLL